MTIPGTRILVQPIKKEEGPIVLLQSDQKQNKGHVVRIGLKVQHVRVGDTVVYHEHSGTPYEFRGDELLFLDVGDRNRKGDVVSVL